MGILGISDYVNGELNRIHQKEMLETQHSMNKDIMGLQFDYGERAADAATKRQAKMYENYLSPMALVKQYEAAGLNPALMYGSGGSVGGSMSQGISGGGVNALGVGGVSTNPFSSSGGSIGQERLMNAEARLKEAEARVKEDTHDTEVETANAILDKFRGELTEILSHAGLNNAMADNVKAQTALTGMQTIAQDIANNFNLETYEVRMQQLGQELSNMKEAWRDMARENDFKEETFWDGVDTIRYNNNLILKEIYTESCRAANIKANTAKTWADMKKAIAETKTEGFRTKNEKELYKRFVEDWEKQSEENKKLRKNQTFNTILHGIFSAAAAASFFRGGMGMKGTKPLVKKQTTVWDGKSSTTRFEYGTGD